MKQVILYIFLSIFPNNTFPRFYPLSVSKIFGIPTQSNSHVQQWWLRMNVNSKWSNMSSVLLRSTTRALMLNKCTGKFLVAAHTSWFFFNNSVRCHQRKNVTNFLHFILFLSCMHMCKYVCTCVCRFETSVIFLKKEVLLGLCHDLII